MTETIRVAASATVTDSHIPSISIKIGRSRIEAAKNPNVLKNEISAEIKPFENAVTLMKRIY